MMTRSKIVATGAVLMVLAVVATGIALRSTDGGSGPDLSEPTCVDVEMPSTLRSDARFEVSFRLVDDPGPDCLPDSDPIQIRPPLTLALWDGDKKLNTLITTGSNPEIGPPEGAIVPGVLLRGPGPLTFALPPLDGGDYVLCGFVSVEADPAPVDGSEDWSSERFCREMTVQS